MPGVNQFVLDIVVGNGSIYCQPVGSVRDACNNREQIEDALTKGDPFCLGLDNRNRIRRPCDKERKYSVAGNRMISEERNG